MKILFIVIDGLSDMPIPELGNKTPLEAAKKPNLDFLAQNGVCGIVEPFEKEKGHPTSEDTHLAIFGYNPEVFNPGRGVLEVLGIGMKPLSKDVCLRGNFATVDSGLNVVDRRAGRIEETKELIRAISDIEIEGVKFLIGKMVSHRIGIIMRGKNLSPKVSSNDPDAREIIPLDKTFEAKFTADVLNNFFEKTHRILKNNSLNKRRIKKGLLPANYILVRGAGNPRQVMPFQEKWQMKPCCIAGGALYKGIAKFLGFDLIKTRGANSLPSTNLKGKISTAKESLRKYDFVFCHIKAADNLAEDGNFLGKKEFIEKIDESLGDIVGLKTVYIVVTGDHSTCSLLRKHCSEPVPLLVYKNPSLALRNFVSSGNKNGIKSDVVQEFSEKDCKKGKLGKIKQLDLLSKIFTL